METTTTQETNENLLPAEVRQLAHLLPAEKQDEIRNVMNQIFSGTADWSRQVDEIVVKDVNDTMSIALATTAKKNAKDARLAAEKIIDAKRAFVQNQKADYDTEDKLWLKTKQIVQISFKAIEEKAEWKANFVKRHEAEQRELKTQLRISEVSKYAELNRIEFEFMSDESFGSFLTGLKATYDAKIEAERKAEEQRIANEKAEIEAREQQRIENERLKAEAEIREKELQAERERADKIKAEADRVAKEEADRVAKQIAEEKAKNDAILAEQKRLADIEAKKQADINAKLEAEIKAKKDAEIQAENKRKADELKAQKEADKLAKAPMKERLNTWVDSLSLGKPPHFDYTVEQIEVKFEGFRKWAKDLIEKDFNNQ